MVTRLVTAIQVKMTNIFSLLKSGGCNYCKTLYNKLLSTLPCRSHLQNFQEKLKKEIR